MVGEWRPIPGWEGYYEVSDEGQIRSVSRRDSRGRPVVGKIRRPTPNKVNGYPQVGMKRDGRRVMMPIHKAVMLAFVGPRPHGMEVRHLDGNPSNNQLANLEYGTRRQNNLDTVRHGNNRNSAKTHCIHGHEFTEANTYRKAGGKYRECRKCMAINKQRFLERKRAA